MSEKKNNIELVMIIDRSGSMAGMESDTIGGINPGNAAEYAATGVDGLATTAPFTAKPLDMSVRMTAL